MKVKFTEEKCLNYDLLDFRMIGFWTTQLILESSDLTNPNSDK